MSVIATLLTLTSSSRRSSGPSNTGSVMRQDSGSLCGRALGIETVTVTVRLRQELVDFVHQSLVLHQHPAFEHQRPYLHHQGGVGQHDVKPVRHRTRDVAA